MLRKSCCVVLQMLQSMCQAIQTVAATAHAAAVKKCTCTVTPYRLFSNRYEFPMHRHPKQKLPLSQVADHGVSCRAADKVSTTAAVGGQWANDAFKRTWDNTAEGIRRLSGNSLVVCYLNVLNNLIYTDPHLFVAWLTTWRLVTSSCSCVHVQSSNASNVFVAMCS